MIEMMVDGNVVRFFHHCVVEAKSIDFEGWPYQRRVVLEYTCIFKGGEQHPFDQIYVYNIKHDGEMASKTRHFATIQFFIKNQSIEIKRNKKIINIIHSQYLTIDIAKTAVINFNLQLRKLEVQWLLVNKKRNISNNLLNLGILTGV